MSKGEKVDYVSETLPPSSQVNVVLYRSTSPTVSRNHYLVR